MADNEDSVVTVTDGVAHCRADDKDLELSS
jgi:hypothetical protein